MLTQSIHQFTCAYASLEKDWDELMQSFHDSWASPIQPVSQLTFAHIGTNSPEEKQAFEKAKRILLEETREAPDRIFWIKCVDVKTGKIVGGMNYKHEKSWPKDEGNFTPDWFEEGSEMQRLSKGFYEQLLEWRKTIMKGEHLYAEFAWVHPRYRNFSASQIIVEFGLQKADSMGLEVYSEVNQFSAPVALRTGFIVAGWTNMTFSWGTEKHVLNKDVDCIVRAMQAHPIAAVWRPIGGRYVEGKTILPWTGRPRECAKL